MNFKNIGTVYLKELKDSLRDRRTVMSTILIPTLVIPLMTFGFGKISAKVINQAREETPTIMVLGGADSPGVVAQLKASPKLKIVPEAADWKAQIGDKKLRAAVEIPGGFESGLRAGGAPAVKIYFYEGELKSSIGASAVEKFFADLREKAVGDLLVAKALPATLAKPFETKRVNVASLEKVGGNLFGGIVPYLIIILCFTGAMYPAIDLTAGEKERGTMETLLCSPVARVDIVIGKFLMVLTGSVSAMVFMLLSMGTTAFLAGALFTGGSRAAPLAAAAAKGGAASVLPTIDPLGLVGVLAMVLPVAVLFAAIAFTVSLFAKSYKEAQSYLAPMMIVIIMPAAMGMLPGIDLNAKLACVPLLNLSLVCKEMLSGVWHWNYIAIIFGSSSLYAAIALVVAVRMFNREEVLFRA